MARRKMWRFTALLATLIAAAVALSACGSSGSSSSGSSSASSGGSSGSSSANVAEARRLSDPFHTRPTALEVTEPITKPIPTGRSIDFLTCSSPGCAVIAADFRQAATALGWTTKLIEVDATADAIGRAYDTAIRDRPDGLVVVAVSAEVVRDKLATLRSMGVPVVTVQDPDVPFGPIIASVYTHRSSLHEGAVHADDMIANGCGDGTLVYIDVGGFIVLRYMREGFLAEARRLAPKMKIDVVDIGATREGSAQSNVIGAVRSNNATCVFGASDPLITGLPQALRSSGVSKMPQIFSDYGGDTTLSYIRSGLVTSTALGNSGAWGYLLADTLARHFVGQSVAPDQDALQSIWLVDKSNAPASVPFASPDDLAAQYKKLWNR